MHTPDQGQRDNLVEWIERREGQHDSGTEDHGTIAPSVPAEGHSDPKTAALIWAAAGVPVGPYDHRQGKGKSCGNLIGTNQPGNEWYRHLSTNPAQINAWWARWPNAGLCSSPGAVGWLVFDIDKPALYPQHLRRTLSAAPYINTRPKENIRKGHYWFTAPPGLVIKNPCFDWGEVRGLGGGIVLPPFEGRRIIRGGIPPLLPDELQAAFFAEAVVGSEVEHTDLNWFLETYTEETKPYKLRGLQGLYAYGLRNNVPHIAMRQAMRVGFGEARAGYVKAQDVFDTLLGLWERSGYEFRNLAFWCVNWAMAQDLQELEAFSNRGTGIDTRKTYNLTIM